LADAKKPRQTAAVSFSASRAEPGCNRISTRRNTNRANQPGFLFLERGSDL
jgi:hypothetical protein